MLKLLLKNDYAFRLFQNVKLQKKIKLSFFLFLNPDVQPCDNIDIYLYNYIYIYLFYVSKRDIVCVACLIFAFL